MVNTATDINWPVETIVKVWGLSQRNCHGCVGFYVKALNGYKPMSFFSGLKSLHLGEKLSKRKALLSPLCSALIIPGLGQIINQHLKKGVYILLAVFVLFIAGTIVFFRIIQDALKVELIHPSESPYLMDRLKAADFSILWSLLIIFTIIWLYSVLDAYLTGRKLDQREERGRL